jgi:hypothetical protein
MVIEVHCATCGKTPLAMLEEMPVRFTSAPPSTAKTTKRAK